MTMNQEYAATPVPLSTDLGRQFLYARYNADLSRDGLNQLGLPHINPASIQKLDAVENIDALLEIGQAVGKNVKPDHFGPFI
jgi:hypothetical protein